MQCCQILSIRTCENRVVGNPKNFKNTTFWVVLLTKIHLYTNFRSLNPNWAYVFIICTVLPDSGLPDTRIAEFSVSGNPESGNTVQIVKNDARFGFSDLKLV